MKGIFTKVDDDEIVIVLAKEIYEKEAVLSAAYKLTDLCYVLIRPYGESEVEAVFQPKNEKTTVQNLEEYAGRFCNELLDQQLQRDLEKRYGKIREAIVQHAFSPLDNLKTGLGEK